MKYAVVKDNFVLLAGKNNKEMNLYDRWIY